MMYVLFTMSLLLTSSVIQATSFGSTTKELKQPVNFSGKITTHQGQEYIVDNISIDNKYKDIPMYAKPTTHAAPVMNNDTKQLEIKLDANPATDFVKESCNLDEVSEIQVPSPNTIWYYQKKEHQQKYEYIEVVVITKSKTRSSHLLDHKNAISCDEIDAAGPQKKSIPLAALKTLSIEGYSYRDTSKDQSSCPPCAAKNK